MTESEKRRRIDEVKRIVHQEFDTMLYKNTTIRNNTNCYSYAIGSTYPCLQLYRIGAICGKKPINQQYFSIDEIRELLFEDFKVIELNIEESSQEEQINDNQYKIALFVKIYADKKIHDLLETRFNALCGDVKNHINECFAVW